MSPLNITQPLGIWSIMATIMVYNGTFTNPCFPIVPPFSAPFFRQHFPPFHISGSWRSWACQLLRDGYRWKRTVANLKQSSQVPCQCVNPFRANSLSGLGLWDLLGTLTSQGPSTEWTKAHSKQTTRPSIAWHHVSPKLRKEVFSLYTLQSDLDRHCWPPVFYVFPCFVVFPWVCWCKELQPSLQHLSAEGKDVMLTSTTGSGKTLAFLLPLPDPKISEAIDMLDIIGLMSYTWWAGWRSMFFLWQEVGLQGALDLVFSWLVRSTVFIPFHFWSFLLVSPDHTSLLIIWPNTNVNTRTIRFRRVCAPQAEWFLIEDRLVCAVSTQNFAACGPKLEEECDMILDNHLGYLALSCIGIIGYLEIIVQVRNLSKSIKSIQVASMLPSRPKSKLPHHLAPKVLSKSGPKEHRERRRRILAKPLRPLRIEAKDFGCGAGLNDLNGQIGQEMINDKTWISYLKYSEIIWIRLNIWKILKVNMCNGLCAQIFNIMALFLDEQQAPGRELSRQISRHSGKFRDGLLHEWLCTTPCPLIILIATNPLHCYSTRGFLPLAMAGVVKDLLSPFSPTLNVTVLVGKDNHKRQARWITLIYMSDHVSAKCNDRWIAGRMRTFETGLAWVLSHRWDCCRCAEPSSWLHIWWNQRMLK